VVVATATVLRQRHDHAPTLRLVENRATRCKVHGSLLLDRGSDGVAFSQPHCLSCLPAHEPDCAMGEAMATTEILWNHDVLGRWWDGERDIAPSVFRRFFGSARVPTCSCEARQIDRRTEPVPMRTSPPALELHYQPEITAPVYASLRHKIAMMLVAETGVFDYHFAELGDPETHQPGMEAVAGKSARQVLRRLRAFAERDAEKNLRHSPS